MKRRGRSAKKVNAHAKGSAAAPNPPKSARTSWNNSRKSATSRTTEVVHQKETEFGTAAGLSEEQHLEGIKSRQLLVTVKDIKVDIVSFKNHRAYYTVYLNNCNNKIKVATDNDVWLDKERG